MADRFNKCSNPAAAGNGTTTGWSVQGGTLSGAGFFNQDVNVPRPRGVQHSATATGQILRGPIHTPGGSVVGQMWTLSAWVKRVDAGLHSQAFGIEWLNSSGTVVGTSEAANTNVTNTEIEAPKRLRVSGTGEGTGAVAFRLRFVSPESIQVGSVLYEPGGSLLPYLDGDGDDASNPANRVTTNYSWDGTPGLSTSMFFDGTYLNSTDASSSTDESFTIDVDSITDDTGAGLEDFTELTAGLLDAEVSTGDDEAYQLEVVDEDSGIGSDEVIDHFQGYHYDGEPEEGIGTEEAFADATSVADDEGLGDESFLIDGTYTVVDEATGDEVPGFVIILVDDSATGVDGFVSTLATHTIVDDAVGTEQFSINATQGLNDGGTGDDSFGAVYDKPVFFDDLIEYRAPTTTVQRFRVVAQNIFTKEWVHNNLPLSDPELTFQVSNPNLFRGTLNGEVKSLLDLSPALEPEATWLHALENEEVAASYILQEFIDENGQQKRQVEGIGFSAYPGWIDYQGPLWKQVRVDPADIVRYLWTHIQSYPESNLGVKVSPDVRTPVRLGTEPKDVEFETGDGENVSFEAGPYDLNWWEVTNCGTEMGNLLTETPMEYVEKSYWNAARTDIEHLYDLKYPRVGRKNDSVHFIEGQNLIEVIPGYNAVNGGWPSDFIVVGAGEGPTAVRGYISRRTGRLRRTKVIENEDIKEFARAQAIADFEAKRADRSRFYIDSVVINVDHPNARLGEFTHGDDAYVSGKVIYRGAVSGIFRIVGYKYWPRRRQAQLDLAPSESFTYGATKVEEPAQVFVTDTGVGTDTATKTVK